MQLGVDLYTALVTLRRGKALRLLQTVEHRNGFEGWRVLAEEFETHLGQRRLTMLADLINPQLVEPKYVEDLLRWEASVSELQRAGGAFDDELKIAVIMRNSPIDLQKHLCSMLTAFEKDYSKMRHCILEFCRVSRRGRPHWATSHGH